MTDTRNRWERPLDEIKADPQYGEIPPELFDGLDRYIHQRIATGGFLRAALENNFTRTMFMCSHPDPIIFKQLATLLCNEVGSDCWGTPEAVKRWLGE